MRGADDVIALRLGAIRENLAIAHDLITIAFGSYPDLCVDLSIADAYQFLQKAIQAGSTDAVRSYSFDA